MLTLPGIEIRRRRIIVPRGPISGRVFCRSFLQVVRADGRRERPMLLHDDPMLDRLLFDFDQMPDATLIVNAGRAITTALLAGGIAYPKFIGWGTGAGTTGQTDTDLFTPATEARVSGTQSQLTGVTPNDTLQVIGTLQANAAKGITNVALYDAAGTGSPPSGGNMYLKQDFATQSLNLNDTIAFTFQVRYQ